jgi:hypothetical protein
VDFSRQACAFAVRIPGAAPEDGALAHLPVREMKASSLARRLLNRGRAGPAGEFQNFVPSPYGFRAPAVSALHPTTRDAFAAQ